MSHHPVCEAKPGDTWPNALHNLICRPKYGVPVISAHCAELVEQGDDEAFILFCGHIYHNQCLLDIDQLCKRFSERFLVCAVCRVENFHPDCRCFIKMRRLPWTRKEAMTIGLTDMEGGRIHRNCLEHEIWDALHKLCMSAVNQLRLPEDKPFLVYATDGERICWMSHLGSCFKQGGDSLRSNPEVKLSEVRPAIGGIWPCRDDDWSSYNNPKAFPSNVTIRVVLSRPKDIPESVCWACGDLGCAKVLLRDSSSGSVFPRFEASDVLN